MQVSRRAQILGAVGAFLLAGPGGLARGTELVVGDLAFFGQDLRVPFPGAQVADTVLLGNYVVGPGGAGGTTASRPIVPFPLVEFSGIKPDAPIESVTLHYRVDSDFAEPGERFHSEVRLFTINETNLRVANKDAFAAKTGDGGDHVVVGTVEFVHGVTGEFSLPFSAEAIDFLRQAAQSGDATLGIAFREFLGDDALDEFVLGIPPGVMRITVRADGPAVAVFPKTLDFDPDLPSSGPVNIVNGGTQPLDVLGARFDPADSPICTPYTVRTGLPLVVPVGGTAVLDVDFEPQAERTRRCTLLLDHNDPLRRPVEVALGTALRIDVALSSAASEVPPGGVWPVQLELLNELGGPEVVRLDLVIELPGGARFLPRFLLSQEAIRLPKGRLVTRSFNVSIPADAWHGTWRLRAFVLRDPLRVEDASSVTVEVRPAP